MTQASVSPDAPVASPVPPQAQPQDAPSARCTHLFSNGKRCRLSTPYPEVPFCPQHAGLPEHAHVLADLTATLLDGLEDFTDAVVINHFLTRLLRLSVAGKISPRRASILAYIGQLLLRSIPAMIRQDNAPPKVIFMGFPDPKDRKDGFDPGSEQNQPA